MNIHFSRAAIGTMVLLAALLVCGNCWAVFHNLGPSSDDWGLKYDVEVNDDGGDMLTVVFTLADEGRLKPLHTIDLIALSKQTDAQGGRSYDAKEHVEFKTTADGKRSGQVRIRKQFADRAKFRILTLNVDGKRQTAGAAHYDIPLKKFLDKDSAVTPLATPPAQKVTK